MQKQAPTFGRLLVMVGFALSCFGLLLFLWLAFGGPIPLQPEGYRFKVLFPEASQLAQEAEVRISGVPVGKVKALAPSRGRTAATIELDSKYAPIPSDARAILRQKTLLGETYVELTPGSESVRPVKEGGTLNPGQVSDTVELDEIFRAFDPETRANFQNWMQTQAQALENRGQDLSAALGNLAPFATNANQLLTVLNRQEGAVSALVSQTGAVASALAQRSDQLQGLITNGNRVFQTTAQRNRALADTFVVLPTFQRETRATLNDLDRFARNTRPLVNQLRPAARELSPTLVDLDQLAPDLQNFLANLSPLVTAGNRGLPAVRTVLRDLQPLLGQLEPVLRQLNPPLYGLLNYRKEASAFFTNSVAATQATDKPPRASGVVHYLRTTNPINPEILAAYSRRLGTNRPNPYQLPGAFNQLASGLPVYEDRQCGRPLPTIDNTLVSVAGAAGQAAGGVAEGVTNTVTGVVGGLTEVPLPNASGLPQDIIDEVNGYVFGRVNNPDTPPDQLAPPCRRQIPYPPVGSTGQQGTSIYPREFADPPGQTPVNPAPEINPRTGAAVTPRAPGE